MTTRAVAGIAAAVGAYGALQWLGHTAGATRDERRRRLPGDDVCAHPQIVTTHATTIDAPPEAVWPWLVQMGWGRAQWYTARWVDRLLFPANGPSADRIVPELQHIAVDDRILDGPPEMNCSFVVCALGAGPPSRAALDRAPATGLGRAVRRDDRLHVGLRARTRRRPSDPLRLSQPLPAHPVDRRRALPGGDGSGRLRHVPPDDARPSDASRTQPSSGDERTGPPRSEGVMTVASAEPSVASPDRVVVRVRRPVGIERATVLCGAALGGAHRPRWLGRMAAAARERSWPRRRRRQSLRSCGCRRSGVGVSRSSSACPQPPSP